MIYRFLILFTFCFTCLNTVCSYGQTHKFHHLKNTEGLSNNSVTDIVKDAQGFVWFATYNGLNKYDGLKVTSYYNTINDSRSLPDNYTTCLFNDANEQLWIGTRNGGLVKYDTNHDSFEAFPLLGGKIPEVIEIRSIVEDSQHNLWVATITHGLFKINPERNKVVNYSTSMNSRIVLASNNITALSYNTQDSTLVVGSKSPYIELINTNSSTNHKVLLATKGVMMYPKKIITDKNHNIWIADYKMGLFKIEARSKKITNWTTKNSNLQSNVFFNMLYKPKENMLWLATDGAGIQSYNISDNQFFETKKTIDPKSLSSNSILCFYKDNTDVIWIGTQYGGINIYNTLVQQFNTLTAFDGLSHNRIKCFAESPKNKIYIGTDGGGVSIYNRANNTLSKMDLPYPDLSINSLYLCDNGAVLIGSYGKGLWKYNPKTKTSKNLIPRGFLDNNSPEIFIQDAIEINNTIWFGTPYGLYYISKENNLVKLLLNNTNARTDKHQLNAIKCLLKRDKHLWVGTKAGFVKVSLLENKPVAYFKIVDKAGLTPSSENIINKIKPFNNTLYLCTDQGINIFDLVTEHIEPFTSKDISNNHMVYDVLFQNEKQLWVCTNKGLIKHNFENKNSYIYNYQDGLQGNNQNCIIKTHNNEIFVGGNNGFNHFFPNHILQNFKAPPLVFTDFKLFNESVNFLKEKPVIDKHISTFKQLQLKHYQNDISFDFAALDFYTPNHINYSYKLENYDQQWNHIANKKRALYTNLPFGNYDLKIRATDKNNLWTAKELNLQIVISPPWYKTIWAVIGYVFLFIIAMLIFSKLLVNWTTLKHKLEIKTLEKQQTELLNKERIEFFTNISHEFKTPLSLIMAPIDTMIEKGNSFQEENLKLIKQNANRLLRLINQLMDFRKNESKSLELTMETFEVNDFINNILFSFHNLAAQHSIQLTYKPCEPITVKTDKDKLDKILFNLLSNAFKACHPRDSIRVSVNHYTEDGITYLKLKVKDSGKGISKAHLNKIFDRFYQIENKSGGTGVGLSLTKAYIDIMKGTINVNSKPELGTSFKIIIPVNVASQPITIVDDKTTLQDNTPLEIKKSPNASIKKILIVEDEIDILNYLESTLSSNYTIIKATNGEEGIEKALKHWPDLIISDVMMPIKSGFELCEQIKADIRTNHIPVILLTAMTADNNIIEGTDLGADLYVTKPFNIKLLKSQIKTLFSNIKKRQTSYQKTTNNKLKETKEDSIKDTFMAKATQTILNHLNEAEFNAETFSALLNMHRTNLHHKLKTLTGLSTTEFIRYVKLNESLSLLEKDLTVNEIAYKVGFNTPAYFSKCFKKQYDCLPKDYFK